MDAQPLTLWCAMVIDREDPEDASALAREVARSLGLSVTRLNARPYPKLGPHTRVDLDLQGAPFRGFEDMAAQVDRICGALSDGQGWSRGGEHPEEMEYERILDARTDPLRPDWLLWLHVEAAPNSRLQP